MLQTPAPGTQFYRVTDRGRSWPDVLSGAGAYFSFGCRYNRVHQKTVYMAEDPLVSITEYAFHQAVDLQMLIGGGPLSAQPPLPSPPLPLVSEHFLWSFTLQNAPPVVDVEDPISPGVSSPLRCGRPAALVTSPGSTSSSSLLT
jgi:hypothetical protein